MEINRNLLEKYRPALDSAVGLLAVRARSRREIEQRLLRAGFDEEVVSMVLYKLEREKLLDDEDFSVQWVESRKRKYGASRIAMELRMKGVDPETAEAALACCSEEDELETAVSLARRKIRSDRKSCDDRKLFQRVTAFLVRRGYSWEIAKKAWEAALAEESEEEPEDELEDE